MSKEKDCDVCGCPTTKYSKELLELTDEVVCDNCIVNEYENE